MSMLEWNADLDTGVESIDIQHKRLMEMVNGVYDGMLSGKDGFPVLDVIGKLKDYTSYHFSTEEQYMDKHDYPDANAHKLEHRGFEEKVAQVEADCKSGKAAISMDIWVFDV